MRVAVAVVGRPRHSGLAEAIQDYEKRASRYWALDVHEVREERGAAHSATHVREKESERLRERIRPGVRTVACDLDGRRMTSEEFSAWLVGERDAARDIAFLIGGAFGLSDGVKKEAAFRLSLAPWTLAHELARLVLAEQLYRAGTIARGEPYHK
jgi:23S rRNA (pseudouridine1915-N3)-methyltransferase